MVLRLLCGESLAAVSREVGVEVYRLEAWKTRALAGLVPEPGQHARRGGGRRGRWVGASGRPPGSLHPRPSAHVAGPCPGPGRCRRRSSGGASRPRIDCAFSRRNPLDTAHYATAWLREKPFGLDELAAVLPHGWRRPITQPGTDVGRNCWLFDRLMRFGGSPRVTDAEVDHRAAVLNGSLLWSLDAGEVAGIVKSVNGHYRAQWRARGWHQPAFLELQRKRGRAGGLASGSARRAAVAERDRRLIARLEAGESTRAAAAAEGVLPRTVQGARNRLRKAPDFRVYPEANTGDLVPGWRKGESLSPQARL